MNTFKRYAVFFIVLNLFILNAPEVSASDFVIGISDIYVTPSKIYSGDTITIKATYSVSSKYSTQVRLALIFDGDIVDSSTAYRSTGTYDTTFIYTPKRSKTGKYDIGIRARIYDGNILKDEDIVTREIEINPFGKDHEIEIMSVTSKKSVAPLEKIPISVEIKNTGNSREDNLRISAKINKKIYYGNFFSLSPGKTIAETIYVPVPSSSGNYEVEIRVFNSYTSAVETSTLDVQSTSISLNIQKRTAETGEWLEIYGYATRGRQASESAVRLYIDGVYSSFIPTRENGYYSTKVKFDTSGSHNIFVESGGLTTSQNVYISTKQPAETPDPQTQAPKQITIHEGNYTTIIVVTGDRQYLVYPEKETNNEEKPTNISKNTEGGKYANFSFVNIDVSANELDVVKNSGNLLKITITNHLGQDESFSVSSDFEQKWAYLPGTEVIENNKKHVFEIYFNPDKEGTYSGNIFVMQNSKITKTIPLSIYVAAREKKEMPESVQFAPFLGMVPLVLMAIFFILTVAILHFGLKKTKAIEPKIVMQSRDVSEILKAMAEPFENQSNNHNLNLKFVR